MKSLATYHPHIVYAPERELDLFLPWYSAMNPDHHRRPLIVFVQGSAWTTPNRNNQVPQLSTFARMGYIVATVGHRNAKEGYPFPAYLQDVKTAIRFLRTHADEYDIDPEHVAIWGTSSGGNTALLVALTPDDPRYKTEDYADVSDRVTACVSCFGPANMLTMFPPEKIQPMFAALNKGLAVGADPGELALFFGLKGDQDAMTVMRAMSPVNEVAACKKIPPVLLLQGDADPVVPYAQAEEMLKALLDVHAVAEMVRIEGAPHEDNFWSQELLDIIGEFIKKYI